MPAHNMRHWNPIIELARRACQAAKVNGPSYTIITDAHNAAIGIRFHSIPATPASVRAFLDTLEQLTSRVDVDTGAVILPAN